MNFKLRLQYALQIFSFLVLCFSFDVCNAQSSKNSLNKTKDTQHAVLTPQQMVDKFLKDETNSSNDSSNNKATIINPKLDSLKLKAWLNYYDYMGFGYKHRKSVFYWQLISSKIIFFVVIGLVLVGVYFAWLQFYRTLKDIKNTGDQGKALATELSASFKEIKVASPVLGVIILIISFLFFYLYLRYVYPINELF